MTPTLEAIQRDVDEFMRKGGHWQPLVTSRFVFDLIADRERLIAERDWWKSRALSGDDQVDG